MHTLGAGNYSEDDVKASSRILTGWHVDLWKTWAASYVEDDHWTGTVQVRGFRDRNRRADGRRLTKDYLRYLAHRPDTAHRIAERLATKFVRDDPPASLVRRLAKVYLKNDTAIVPVLRALVASKEFRASAGRKLRDPSEDVVATYRAPRFDVGRPSQGDSGANAMLWQASGLGLSPHAWPRPDGTPVTDAVWASPSRALGSMSMHWSMAGGWWPTAAPARAWSRPRPWRRAAAAGKRSTASTTSTDGVSRGCSPRSSTITVDQGDWDMHTDLGALEWGEMKRNAGDLASSIAAFFTDLGPAADRVTLVTLSEFGRRGKENDGYGTDHGFGNVMFVAGAGVRGGRYLGSWPGLTDSLDADLLVTTDYRSVLTEVVTRRFGVSVGQVFPGFAPQAFGVMA